MIGLVVLGMLIIGVGAYYIGANPNLFEEEAIDEPQEVTEDTSANQTISIEWSFIDAGETDNIPYTDVVVIINNISYPVGSFQGSCSEIGATGGIDGKGLLAGELSGVQCWFAGGGDEIGVFAHEDGGVDIMTGALGEGVEGSAFFRGDFKVQRSIAL